MKRFLLFSGPTYYPGGGWGDFVRDFDTLAEATAFAQGQLHGDGGWIDWAHVVDTGTTPPERHTVKK